MVMASGNRIEKSNLDPSHKEILYLEILLPKFRFEILKELSSTG